MLLTAIQPTLVASNQFVNFIFNEDCYIHAISTDLTLLTEIYAGDVILNIGYIFFCGLIISRYQGIHPNHSFSH